MLLVQPLKHRFSLREPEIYVDINEVNGQPIECLSSVVKRGIGGKLFSPPPLSRPRASRRFGKVNFNTNLSPLPPPLHYTVYCIQIFAQKYNLKMNQLLFYWYDEMRFELIHPVGDLVMSQSIVYQGKRLSDRTHMCTVAAEKTDHFKIIWLTIDDLRQFQFPPEIGAMPPRAIVATETLLPAGCVVLCSPPSPIYPNKTSNKTAGGV